MPRTTKMSPKLHLGTIYWSQVQRSKKKGFPPPAYGLNEFRDKFLNTDLHNHIWKEYKKSGCEREKSPSIDRIDDSKPYTFDNIRLTTWGENKAKGHKDIREGKLIHGNNPQKAVEQIHMSGNSKRYVSTAQASRETGISRTAICNCLTGRSRIAGGYVWMYVISS